MRETRVIGPPVSAHPNAKADKRQENVWVLDDLTNLSAKSGGGLNLEFVGCPREKYPALIGENPRESVAKNFPLSACARSKDRRK
jgi:hypothetical protein